MRLPCLAVLLVLGGCASAAEVWLFAGQSNMDPRAQSRGAFAVLDQTLGRAERRMVSAQKDGRPIAFWADDQDGWRAVIAALATVGPGDRLAGMVFHQGESNERLFRTYQGELVDLIARLRRTAGDARLPIYLNQLGPRYVTGRYQASNGAWSMGLIREIQRRVALADPQVHLIACVDLALRDTNVHLDAASHAEIGRRIGLAATGHPCGPIPVAAWRLADRPQEVHLRCTRVDGRLVLGEGWRLAASCSPLTAVPEDLAAWPEGSPDVLLPPERVVHPVDARVVADDTVVFTFATPPPAGAFLHWAGQAGGNPLDQREAQPSLRGLTDASGIGAAATLLLPIAAAPP